MKPNFYNAGDFLGVIFIVDTLSVSKFPINRLLFELLVCWGCQEGQLSQTLVKRNFSSQDAFAAYLGPQFPVC